MRYYFLIFILITSFINLSAQEFTPSRSQKAVAKSTDAIMIALPVAALTGVLVQKDWKGLIQGVETAAATTATTLILKYSIKEMRPDYSNTHSFPSGHSSISFATAAFLQRRYGWGVGAPAYALSCYVAWGRVFAKKHHVWDVCAGAVIGAASAYIFTTPFARKHNLQVAPVADDTHIGAYLSLNF
ncbi:MAG: phosphatase PAP2 family protein [Muribaculaceae bacterium]|nr:phosphatase PAP2 family protein [Muribaculaceae bacterium]